MEFNSKLEYLKKIGNESAVLRKAVVEELGPQILDTAALISGVIGAGGKILIAGNGGSAADASHFAAEMIVRLTPNNNRHSLPAVALTVDPSVLTAAGNDYGFDNIFSRQVEGLGSKGDMLFVMSTSGNSNNIINAVKAAKDRGMITVGLLGGTGGKLGKMVEKPLIIPHPLVLRIQEEHIFIIHCLVELVESDLF